LDSLEGLLNEKKNKESGEAAKNSEQRINKG